MEFETPPEKKTLNTATTQRKAKQYGLNYDGSVGSLYKIVLLDFFMRIITIGIYAFWGRTRMRKYLVSHFSLEGDRFEYTGTGGELFKGFLKALPILLIILIPIGLIEAYPIFILFYIPLIYVIGLAIYGAIRYRYSRTRWRGIGGYVGGSSIKYANLSIRRMLLNAITLGLTIPASDIKKHKYIMDNTYFGSIKAEYNGNSKLLFWAHIKSMLLLVAMIIALVAIIASIGFSFAQTEFKWEDENYVEEEYDTNTQNTFSYEDLTSLEQNMEQQLQTLEQDFNFDGFNEESVVPAIMMTTIISGFLIIFLFISFGTISRSIYTAALMREKMRGLQIGNLHFMCNVTAWDLIKHKTANTLIMLVTLGLGYPFIIQRNMKFFARNHLIMGNMEDFCANQVERDEIRSGEGLDAAFNLDTGFM